MTFADEAVMSVTSQANENWGPGPGPFESSSLLHAANVQAAARAVYPYRRKEVNWVV